MIASRTEYEKAHVELRLLEERRCLQQSQPGGSEGFTEAGVRKMIARLYEELAVYESSEEAPHPDTN